MATRKKKGEAKGLMGEGADCRTTLAMTGEDCSATLAMTGEVGKKLPLVSVLMPTRDGNPEWMVQAIDSIARQDYEGVLELVVVNHDCRLSMTKQIQPMLEKNTSEKFQIGYTEVADASLQFSEVLDIGVGVCKGEIIVRMDHDDIADPQLVSKVVDYLVKHPKIDVVGVQIVFFGGKEIVTHHPEIVNRQLAARLPNCWFINHPGATMRKTALLEVGGYGVTKQGYAEDYHLWCKFLKSGREIANIPNVLLKYRCYAKEGRRPEGYMDFLEREKAGLREK